MVLKSGTALRFSPPFLDNPLLTPLRCDLSSLGLVRLVSLLELLLLCKLWGGMGGLVLTGPNVMLCLVNIFAPGEPSGVTLCVDLVPSRPADDWRRNWATEGMCGEIEGWSSSGGSTVGTRPGVLLPAPVDLHEKDDLIKTTILHLRSLPELLFMFSPSSWCCCYCFKAFWLFQVLSQKWRQVSVSHWKK